MWTQFFLENIHFGLNILVAGVFFACFWLYYDAWLARKGARELTRISGFLFLSISFAIHATQIESTILITPLLKAEIGQWLVAGTKIAGYLLLLFSLATEALMPQPGEEKGKKSSKAIVLPMVVMSLYPALTPILAGLVGLLYLRRATLGLEAHVKKPALAFIILAFYEIIDMTVLFRKTDNIDVYKLVAPFGIFWLIEHLVLLTAILILSIWVFNYLLKRFETQIFIFITASILAVFLITTVSFSALLLNNLRNETLNQIETDVKVLSYAIENKKSELSSSAEILAQNQTVIAAASESSREGLAALVQEYLLSKKESSLIVVNIDGQVLARGEDKERVGDSLSDDALIKRILKGESNSSIVTKDGVIAPEVHVRSGIPIKNGEEVVGAVVAGEAIDSAFVDGIKTSTGLEASVYGGNQLSATTFLAIDGKTRPLGIYENSNKVKTQVLTEGRNYKGSVSILNSSYFAAYFPLKDVDNTPVGMLFVGKPEIAALQAAGRTIELTFLIAAILIVFSILPANLISMYITRQIR
jgi:hypothetical protein